VREDSIRKLLGKLGSLGETELHALVQRLSQEMETRHKIFDLLSEGVLLLNGNYAIEYGNRAAKEIFGLADSQRQAIFHCVPELSFLRQFLRKSSPNIPFAVRELEIKYPHRKFVSINGVHTATANGDGAYILVVRDATAANNFIEQRVTSERFSTINLLASGVAHELGNPLNAVGLRLHLMQKQLQLVPASEGSRQLQKSLSICEEEISRLDGIIKNFLQAIRPQELDLRPTNIGAVVNRVLEVLAPELANGNIRVRKKFSAMPPILADAPQLEQAFFNIVKNSIEASHARGSILIASKLTATKLLLEFTDNGEGIAEEDIPRVTDSYFSTKKRGTGLGMMIVERIVHQHGATLSIQSQRGLGTKISIAFPTKDPSLPLFGQREENG
jgi:signal transduction histidine kinase